MKTIFDKKVSLALAAFNARIKNCDIIICTEKDIKTKHKFAGKHIKPMPIFVEKEILLQHMPYWYTNLHGYLWPNHLQNDKYQRIPVNARVTRQIGYSTALAKLLITSDCIVIVDNEQARRYLINLAKDQIVSNITLNAFEKFHYRMQVWWHNNISNKL